MLRQFSLLFLHVFWALNSHKFGDDIQGTISNTKHAKPFKDGYRRHVFEKPLLPIAYTNIKRTRYRHITPPISMTTRWKLKLKLIVMFHHHCTLAYHRDQGPRTDETLTKPSQYTFFEGVLFQDGSNHVGCVTNDKKIGSKKYSWHHDCATQKTSSCLTNILQNHVPPKSGIFCEHLFIPKDHWTLKTGYFEDPNPVIQVQTLPLEGPRSLGMVN